MATVAINATDHFGLGANFHPQSSSVATSEERKNILDENGNLECESMVGPKSEYSTTYAYCNGTPDIKTDLGTILTSFGYVLSSGGATENMFVTGLTINFNDGEYAEVSMTGVAYGDGTMPAAATGIVSDVSTAVPASAGFGAPTLTGVTLGTDAAVSSVSISFSLNHIMATDGNGDFFVGQNITYEASADAEYTGVPSSYTTVTNWTTDSYTAADGNENFDTVSWSGHRNFDKA